MPLVDAIKLGSSDGLSDKMRALLHIARTVRREPRDLAAADVSTAQAAGASDADVQLAVLIAAAFSMYNRMVKEINPGQDGPERRGVRCARRRDRGARLQRPARHVRPEIGARTGRYGPGSNKPRD